MVKTSTKTLWGTVVAAVTLTIGLGATDAQAQLSVLDRYTVDADIAETRGAYCNDGTLPIYYYEPATDHEAGGTAAKNAKWIIYLEGGEGCYDEGTCAARWTSSKRLMTSNVVVTPNPFVPDHNIATKVGKGFFSGSEEFNAQFANMHKVFIHYCSSDGWTGMKTLADPENDPDPAAGIVNMAGAKIIPAVFDDIDARAASGEFSYTPYEALRLFFSGESAGGFGALANANRMRNTLAPLGVKMRLIAAANTPTMINYRLREYLDSDSVTTPGITLGEEIDGADADGEDGKPPVSTDYLYAISDDYETLSAEVGRFAEAWIDPACEAEHGDDADYCYTDVARMEYLDDTLKSFFTLGKQDATRTRDFNHPCLVNRFAATIEGTINSELGGQYRAYFYPETLQHMRLIHDQVDEMSAGALALEGFDFDGESQSLLGALTEWAQADGDGTDVKYYQPFSVGNAFDPATCPAY